jgi:hypothetical protein
MKIVKRSDNKLRNKKYSGNCDLIFCNCKHCELEESQNWQRQYRKFDCCIHRVHTRICTDCIKDYTKFFETRIGDRINIYCARCNTSFCSLIDSELAYFDCKLGKTRAWGCDSIINFGKNEVIIASGRFSKHRHSSVRFVNEDNTFLTPKQFQTRYNGYEHLLICDTCVEDLIVLDEVKL